MKATVEPLEGNKVKLSVEVDEAEFDKAIDGDLTPGQFLSNIWHSFEFTWLEVPSDPVEAARRWCPP